MQFAVWCNIPGCIARIDDLNTRSYSQSLEQELFPALRTGALAVTATSRLARRMRFRYGRWRRASGASVWRRPAVLSWHEWMRQLWEDSLLGGGQAGELTLLSSHGSLMLWEQALDQDAVAGFDREQNAELARGSWNLALEYGLSLERLRSEAEGEDEHRFARWAVRFEELRKSGNWLEPAALPTLLTTDLLSGAIAASGPVFLLGFDRPLPPPQAQLLECVRSAGVAVQHGPRAGQAGSIGRAAYETADAELQAAASWTAQGDAALVLIDFSERAAQARRALLECMQPAWQMRGFPQDAPLNSAAAPSLDHAGPVEMALDALCLLPAVIEFETLSRILRGAYLAGSDNEAGARAQLERRLRETLVGSEMARTQFMASAITATPLLAEALWRALKLARETRGKGRMHSHRNWAASFMTFLRGLGWPGQRTLVSSEQQAVEAFTRLLSEFGACDAVSSAPIALSAALSRLRAMGRERKFQPQGPDEAVELLSVDEAAGMHFERLWVAGARANLWPCAAAPQALIPLRLQRRLKMPKASAQAALEQARRQTEALVHAAEEVIFSWSRVGERGEENSCSPLVAPFPLNERANEADTAAPTYAEALRVSTALKALEHDPAPPLAPDEEISGGTRLMDQQLANPFRAFAEHRLHAEEYPMPQDGISPLVRGDIAHRLMRRLFTECGDAETLRAALPDLAAQLEEWAAEIPKHEPRGLRPLVLGLLRLERERAVQLALDWAQIDLQRGDFRVARLEESEELNLGPLTLRMRLDRVDAATAEAGPMVLDYKTGNTPPFTKLDPQRLLSSQLPAYALVTPGVAAVGYARLSPKETSLVGVSNPRASIPGEEQMPKLRPLDKQCKLKHCGSWNELLNGWRNALREAARALCRGDARIEVFRIDDAARGQYQVLSRIHELERA